ncbi:MAG: hypothetical protein M9941_11040, partial [Anaerolineae bacterium]|nr:hypothetical protein [Anaerolineae bacterium]
ILALAVFIFPTKRKPHSLKSSRYWAYNSQHGQGEKGGQTQSGRRRLISLISFGLTIVIVRVFLQLTGYPQVGNSVLHITHAIWGGLLLFIALLLVLIVANRWVFAISWDGFVICRQ